MIKLKIGDIIVIGVILLIAGGWIAYQHWEQNSVDTATKLSAVITVDGKEYEKVSLKQDVQKEIEIQTDYGHNILKIYDHGIQMVYSDCPKKISMKMGFISKPSQVIICLPNRVFVEIVEDKPSLEEEHQIDGYI
ncbi:NusG domain II-containing protein [Paenibacillus turicensis]|uniref:NusG domain II-containing protein n=1 Tax=Paenibacillus turicensis TaxID=160487 RepID=UPI003D2BE94E